MNHINFEEKLISEIVLEFVVSKRIKSYQRSEIFLLLFVLITFLSFLTYNDIVHIYTIAEILLLIITMNWLYNLSNVIEESILIIRDFGIQLRQKYYYGNEVTKVIYSYIYSHSSYKYDETNCRFL